MNYLSNLFRGKKKPNVDAIVIANELFYGNMELNNDNIESLIKKNRIPVKMNDSFKNDIKNEYNRLMQNKQNDTRMYEDELEYTKQERDLDAIREKYIAKPVTTKQDIDEDVWVTSSSSIDGGARRKRRKTKSKRRKSKKTRKRRRL